MLLAQTRTDCLRQIRLSSCVIIGGLILSLYLLGISTIYKPTPDSCEYVGLAQSLARGEGYQFNGISGSQHPPLTSIVLATIMTITRSTSPDGPAIAVMKLLQVILALLFALGTWRLAGQYLDEHLAQLAGLMVGANIVLFQHTMFILSDVLYCTLSIWALVLLQEHQHRHWIWAVVLISLAWCTRMIGIALLASLAAWLVMGQHPALSRGKRWFLAIFLPFIASLPLIFWKYLYPTTQNRYIDWFYAQTGSHDIPSIISHQVRVVFPTIPLRSVQLLFNIERITLPWYAVLAVFLVLLWAWLTQFIRRQALMEWYVLFYLAVVSITADQGPRYYLPLLPCLVIYALLVGKWLIHQANDLPLLARPILFVGLPLMVILAIPLLVYIFKQGVLPRPVSLLRSGYIFSVLAGGAVLAGIACWLLKKCSLATMAAVLFLAVYFVCGVSYQLTYSLLEHGWANFRPPMLMGYNPYYRMGLWLKQQKNIEDPILCAHPAIIHLASGKIARSPAPSEPKAFQELKNGQFRGILWLKESGRPSGPGKDENRYIQSLLEKHPLDRKQIQYNEAGWSYHFMFLSKAGTSYPAGRIINHCLAGYYDTVNQKTQS